ncbi:acetylglutamate kinase [Brevibacillus ruminantium]|uniref:Acetylglutamate kinase n=1 Tax=Brevibacillus ruminantium TaxID=2950604 RepID=A0ABY4WGZ6_9BACL|nr:acetylglutamate kinase [Brevibacillus ruminantium]USG65297.1 acetylglutamate kinase [Brevibacillus ruminantium]
MEGIVVIKCGGSTMEQLPDRFFQAIAEIQQKGKQLVIVHGGGPAINSMLERLAIPSQFVDGLRVTCEDTLQVVEQVLCGQINKWLVRRLSEHRAKAWGVSGMDGGMLTAVQTDKPLGLVGEVKKVDAAIPLAILSHGYLPVIAPLAVGTEGSQKYNVNADIAAGAIAAALGAESLIMVTDVPGILAPKEEGTALIPKTNPREIEQMIQEGIITGGMIPKVRAALDALSEGVPQVVICRGTAEDLLRVCQGETAGTAIVSKAAQVHA